MGDALNREILEEARRLADAAERFYLTLKEYALLITGALVTVDRSGPPTEEESR